MYNGHLTLHVCLLLRSRSHDWLNDAVTYLLLMLQQVNKKVKLVEISCESFTFLNVEIFTGKSFKSLLSYSPWAHYFDWMMFLGEM